METRTPPTLGQFLDHLTTALAPLIVRRGGSGPEWDDAPLHAAMYDQEPALYALLGVSAGVTADQRARVLYQLLARSRAETPAETRRTLERITSVLLAALHPDTVLTVFLGLRRARANHKHTTRAIVHYILNHPHLADMARHRRPALVDSLEHALGRDVVRGAVRMLETPGGDPTYPRRHLLRWARDPALARTILAWLYHEAPEAALVPTEVPLYTTSHQSVAAVLDGTAERPKTVTATNRGDIAATLVHLYRGGAAPELQQALGRYVAEAVDRLPRYEGRVALVLDASASTRGYGEREYCNIAQSVAFQQVLAHCCSNLRTVLVGGTTADGLPQPSGPTDLAGALLEALAGDPDLAVIVSDGYENLYGGDLARVAASLAPAGITTPVVFCHSKFGPADDLALRRPAGVLPEMEFWHQDDFLGVLLRLFAQARGGVNTEAMRAFLARQLTRIEKEVDAWTFAN